MQVGFPPARCGSGRVVGHRGFLNSGHAADKTEDHAVRVGANVAVASGSSAPSRAATIHFPSTWACQAPSSSRYACQWRRRCCSTTPVCGLISPLYQSWCWAWPTVPAVLCAGDSPISSFAAAVRTGDDRSGASAFPAPYQIAFYRRDQQASAARQSQHRPPAPLDAETPAAADRNATMTAAIDRRQPAMPKRISTRPWRDRANVPSPARCRPR